MLSAFLYISEEEESLLSEADSYMMPIIAFSVLPSHLLTVLDSSIAPSLLNTFQSFSPLSASPLSQPRVEYPVLEKPWLSATIVLVIINLASPQTNSH